MLADNFIKFSFPQGQGMWCDGLTESMLESSVWV